MAGFSILDTLNKISKTNLPEEISQNTERRKISVYQIVPSKKNFYNTDELAELKATIEIVGVLQDILIKPIPDTENYEIIAGHKRWMCCKSLTDEGKDFEFMDCIIDYSGDAVKQELMLIFTNSTARELSPWEKMEQYRRLRPLIEEYKKTNHLPGRVRELLAKFLSVSPSQVGRMESIENNLIDEHKEQLETGNLSMTTAAELSYMSAADQRAVYEQTGGAAKLSDVRKVQKEPEQEKEDDQAGPAFLIVEGTAKPKASGEECPEKVTPAAALPIDAETEAMNLFKALLEKELSNFSAGVDDSEIVRAYCALLSRKVVEIEKELSLAAGDGKIDTKTS